MNEKAISLLGLNLGRERAGIRTHEGLSSLPVFKFERIPSASVHTEQSRTILNPPKATLSAGMHPLGGQGGGQIARVARTIKPYIFSLNLQHLTP
jgi:hypothetical protein